MCKLTSTVLRRRPQPPGHPFPARPWASYPVPVDRVGLRPWRTSKNSFSPDISAVSGDGGGGVRHDFQIPRFVRGRSISV